MSEQNFAQDVWDNLSKYDVEKHTEILSGKNKEGQQKRPDVPYLPWHKALMLVKRDYPATTYEHKPDMHHLDSSMEVEVEIQVRKTVDGECLVGSARLPVMDSRFNPIREANSCEINYSRQRCLVKAIAFTTGLGLNLWGGDPMPVGRYDEPINSKQAGILVELVELSNSDEGLVLEWLGVDDITETAKEQYANAKSMLLDRARQAGADVSKFVKAS